MIKDTNNLVNWVASYSNFFLKTIFFFKNRSCQTNDVLLHRIERDYMGYSSNIVNAVQKRLCSLKFCSLPKSIDIFMTW